MYRVLFLELEAVHLHMVYLYDFYVIMATLFQSNFSNIYLAYNKHNLQFILATVYLKLMEDIWIFVVFHYSKCREYSKTYYPLHLLEMQHLIIALSTTVNRQVNYDCPFGNETEQNKNNIN